MLLADNQQLRKQLQKYQDWEQPQRPLPFTERRNYQHAQPRPNHCARDPRKDSHCCQREERENSYLLKCCQNCLEKVQEWECVCSGCSGEAASWLDGRISRLRWQNDRLRSYCSPN